MQQDTTKSRPFCVKCGHPVVVTDRATTYPSPVPDYVFASSGRFVALCSNPSLMLNRDHGMGEGNTAEAALAAYAKDQEWGMRKIERLEELESQMAAFDLEAERLRITQANYHLRKKVDAARMGRP